MDRKNWNLLSRKEVEELDSKQIKKYQNWLDDLKLSSEMELIMKEQKLGKFRKEGKENKIIELRKEINE